MAEGSDAITGKFDFYDILGYLIPGLVLVGLLSLPFGLITGSWPSTSLTSAVLYLVGAHILGHILQGLLRAWERIPQIRDKSGSWRNPSSVLLDPNQELMAPLHIKIGELANKFWGIPEKDDSKIKPWKDIPDSKRDTAFLQARNLLLQSKKQSYIEAFQGKYALLGGMAVSFLIAFAYYTGWAVALFLSECIGPKSALPWWVFAACLVFFVGFLAFVYRVETGGSFRGKRLDLSHEPTRKKFRFSLLLFLAIGTVPAGFFAYSTVQEPSEKHEAADQQKGSCGVCAVCCAGNSESGSESKSSVALKIEHKGIFMLLLGTAALGAAIRCYGGYKAFAREFATAVWRDFANFELLGGSGDQGGTGRQGTQATQGAQGTPGAVGDA